MLEVDGKKICQSVAIANFLARRCGLSGKNEFEAAQAEMIVLTGDEIVASKFDKTQKVTKIFN